MHKDSYCPKSDTWQALEFVRIGDVYLAQCACGDVLEITDWNESNQVQ
jgi:hypothetical protein